MIRRRQDQLGTAASPEPKVRGSPRVPRVGSPLRALRRLGSCAMKTTACLDGSNLRCQRATEQTPLKSKHSPRLAPARVPTDDDESSEDGQRVASPQRRAQSMSPQEKPDARLLAPAAPVASVRENGERRSRRAVALGMLQFLAGAMAGVGMHTLYWRWKWLSENGAAVGLYGAAHNESAITSFVDPS